MTNDEGQSSGGTPPDACDEAGPSEGLIFFETGTGTTSNGGPEVSIIQMVGARFTTTETKTITGVGGHFVKTLGSAEVFVAVVPLETNGYPASPDLTNAIGFGSGTIVEGPAQDYEFATSFTLQPGTYGLIAGSGRLGVANNEATLRTVDDHSGSPDLFMWQGDSENPQWVEAQVAMAPVRLFVAGN